MASVNPRDFGITITGDEQIDKSLRFLEYRLQKALVRDATSVAAKTVVMPRAFAKAPKDTGALASDIKVRKLIGDEILKPASGLAKGKQFKGAILAEDIGIGSQVVVERGYAGEGGEFYYGAAVELGLSKKNWRYKKQSFLRPALYDNAVYIKAIFVLALRRFIKAAGK